MRRRRTGYRANWQRRYRSRRAAIAALRALIPPGTKLIVIDTFSKGLRA